MMNKKWKNKYFEIVKHNKMIIMIKVRSISFLIKKKKIINKEIIMKNRSKL